MSHDGAGTPGTTQTAETAEAESSSMTTIPRRVSWARYGYVCSAGVFTVCALVQIYVAGLAVFVDSTNWELHATFVHLFEPLLLVLLVFAFVGRLPRLLKLVPVGLFVLLSVQYATASMFGSTVAALHPVNAVVIVLSSLAATKRAWSHVGSATTA